MLADDTNDAVGIVSDQQRLANRVFETEHFHGRSSNR